MMASTATDIIVQICKCLLGYTRTLTSIDAAAGLVDVLAALPFSLAKFLSIILAFDVLSVFYILQFNYFPPRSQTPLVPVVQSQHPEMERSSEFCSLILDLQMLR